jgi:hypothetical protein
MPTSIEMVIKIGSTMMKEIDKFPVEIPGE